MKLKYILMCVLAMIGIAMQAQNNVRYEISSTPATEVVEGHFYVLQNRANPVEVLAYSNNIALTTGWGSIPFGNCMDYQSYFITAGADGFTLPITLDNVNRYFGPGYAGTGYGETEGGTVIGPKRKAADNTVYFTVKDADGQYVLLDVNYGLMGANATKITENAQWIAYEAKVHTQHVWECREGYDGHVCSLCDQEESHNVPNVDGKCTVCDYTCPEHNYSFNDRASILATKEQGKSIMVYECNNCHYQKTIPVETEGKCEVYGSGHRWNEYSYDPTCAMPGYTVHRCYNCNLEYYTDFTDIKPDNHLWYAASYGHFCANGCAEHGASWAEHTMVEGKCTVCGYWPGHTEHQWLTDSNGHFCTIPGCEYSDWEFHTMEEGSCACTVCGHIEHRYQNGVCQNCGTGCQHANKTLSATADENGLYHYICDVCQTESENGVIKSGEGENAPAIELMTITDEGGNTTYTAASVAIADGEEFQTPVAFTAQSDQVSVNRTFTDEKPGSVMLPFSVPASQISGAIFYEFGGVSYDTGKQQWVATMKPVDNVVAYKPYLVVPTGTSITFGTSSESVTFLATSDATNNMTQTDSETGWTFKAVKAPKTWSEDDPELGKAYGFAGEERTVNGEHIAKGQFVKLIAGATAAPGRSYLTKENADWSNNAKAMAKATNTEELPSKITVRFIDGETTGISIIDAETGEMTPVQWYDMNGRKIEKPAKGGLYIKNNKKIMVK